MWGRQTLLSCLKTNDLLTWLSPDDTFPPPPHQHQYIGRLNYQNRPSLSLLGYKVKKLVFAQSMLHFLFQLFSLPDVLSSVSYFLLSPTRLTSHFSPYQTYFTPEGPALTKAGGGPFAFCACKYQIVVVWLCCYICYICCKYQFVVVWLCCYISLQTWNDIVALFAYFCLRPDLVFRAF